MKSTYYLSTNEKTIFIMLTLYIWCGYAFLLYFKNKKRKNFAGYAE